MMANAVPSGPTPQQTKGNRKIALALALFAFGVFATFIVRQWLASS
jgi:hypothetical protein